MKRAPVFFAALAVKSSNRLHLLFAHLAALGFQLGVLIGREDPLGFFQKSRAALCGAAGFHAFSLPGIEFGLLIGGEIEAGETAARHFVGRAFRATSFSTGKRGRSNDKRRRDKR